MLFLGGLAETGGSVFIGLSFAHSSLIVRSDILSCASSLTILKAQTENFSVGVWIKFRAFDLERHSGNLVNDNLFRTFAPSKHNMERDRYTYQLNQIST